MLSLVFRFSFGNVKASKGITDLLYNQKYFFLAVKRNNSNASLVKRIEKFWKRNLST